MQPRPSNEAFDAMNDAAFCDWWDAFCEAAQAAASSEDEVEAAFAVRDEAFNRRFVEA